MAINRQGTQTSGSTQTQEQAQERPKGRIDHPVGKQQYLDKEEEETTQEQERPKGRIDHPEGKQQYLDKKEPKPVPVEDKSTVTVTYTVRVLSFGNDEAFVRKTVLGARRKNSKINFPITVTYADTKADAALALAKSLLAVDAQIEVKKNISIEVTII